MNDCCRQVTEAAIAVGKKWRNNWSDFDGRILLHQMKDLINIAEKVVTLEDYLEDWGLSVYE